MRPEDAKVIAGFLLNSLEWEIKTTAAVLAAAPADALAYKPDSKSKSAVELLRHITLEDEWLLDAVATGSFAPMPDASDACGILTPADAVARYNERIPAVLARIRDLPGDALARPIEFFGNMLPAVNVLSVALCHSVHHRGQLSTYLRPMGGKIPSIYGPTADTPMAAA